MTITFRPCAAPRVSVIVLAWRQCEHLANCLRALRQAADGSIPCEVVIVLNGASSEVETLVRSGVRGARVVCSTVNLGFGGGNNLGAVGARGEYLVLLNDDAVVEPGWLEWLVATADANPRAGAVGSCVLFPDGEIQEAGSIIWRDGSTMPVARHHAGDSLDWHFVRRVDYASACSLLVRRRIWDAVGGFDEDYFPAYYEDVDLCLAIRARGEYVLFEPRSRVRHHESASSNEGVKRLLFARNQRRLAAKWGDELALQEPAAPESPAAVTRAVWRARGCPPRVLIFDDILPERRVGAGFGRMFDALLELAENGYAPALFPALGPTAPSDVLVSKGVAVVFGDVDACLSSPGSFYDVVIVSRPQNFDKVERPVRQFQRWAKLVYDGEALYWRRFERQAALTENAAEAQELRERAARMRELEQRILRKSDHAVTVSQEEADILLGVDGHCPVSVLQPTEPGIRLTTRTFAGRRDVAYVAGWLGGPRSPNAHGLFWFAREVLPQLRERLPWVRLRVTGANPPAEVLELASPNLVFEGNVQDLPGFYDEVRAVVVPLRFGAGVKLKAVEALQYGVPVVSTSIGCEGIDTRGHDAIDVTDDPERFAAGIATLLTDRQAWQRRRAAIEALVEPWRRPAHTQTWTGVLERALSGERRDQHSTSRQS